PCIATYVLSVALFRCRLAAFISALAAVMDSYVYLLYEGGQFGVAVAYGCMPLVLWAFIRGQRRGTLTSFLLTGILLSLQVVYDIRSTYISLGLLLLYGLVCCAEVLRRRGAGGVRTWLRTLGLPQIVVALMVVATVHAWWTLPALVFRAPALPPG